MRIFSIYYGVYNTEIIKTVISIDFSDVPILHLIPSPFPSFWHKSGDNRDNIDMAATENINKILRAFVASYLGMDI